MVTLRRKKTETISGYFFSGQTHALVIGDAKATPGDFIAVDDDGEPSAILPAEYVQEHFEEAPKRGRKKAEDVADERQQEIPGA